MTETQEVIEFIEFLDISVFLRFMFLKPLQMWPHRILPRNKDHMLVSCVSNLTPGIIEMEENTVYLRGGKALNMNLDWGVRRKRNLQ